MDAGNDLARCLNWGGGLYVLRDRGLPAMLHDVEHATVSLLDRWAVQITRQPQELSSAAQQIQRMSSLVARDKPEAEQVHAAWLNPVHRLATVQLRCLEGLQYASHLLTIGWRLE